MIVSLFNDYSTNFGHLSIRQQRSKLQEEKEDGSTFFVGTKPNYSYFSSEEGQLAVDGFEGS